MTIAAGFVCRDGLLFASDTLYSGAQRQYGRKFWHTTWGKTELVFGGAGTQAGLLRTRDEIERRVHATDDRYVVIDAVEDSLRVVLERLQPAPHERTEALVGIRTPEGRCYLYENQPAGTGTMLSVVDRDSQCVGYGHSLGIYFADALFKHDMTMEWAKIVAAHLVLQVKTYASGYCGGRTNLIQLPQAGDVTVIDNKGEIAGYEKYLAEIDGAMRLVLPDKRINDDTARSRVERINEAIRSLQKQFFLRAEPGELKLSGTVTTLVIKKPEDSE